jgi:hypothetical protein
MSNIKLVYTNCCYKSYCFYDNYYSDDENDTELDPINIYDEYSHREVINNILLSQSTWTNRSNHLQNSKNTLKMQDKKKQIY